MPIPPPALNLLQLNYVRACSGGLCVTSSVSTLTSGLVNASGYASSLLAALALLCVAGVCSFICAILSGILFLGRLPNSSAAINGAGVGLSVVSMIFLICGFAIPTKVTLDLNTLLSLVGVRLNPDAGLGVTVVAFLFSIARLVMYSSQCCCKRADALGSGACPCGGVVVIAHANPARAAFSSAAPVAVAYNNPAAYAPAAAPPKNILPRLPPNWVRCGPDENGDYWYENRVTSVSQWDFPTA
jgi:hypothetical protein